MVGFQEKGSFKGEKVVGTEPVREEVRECPEFCCGLRGYQDFHVGGGAEFLEELAAVPAGGGGDGKGNQVGLCIQGELGGGDCRLISQSQPLDSKPPPWLPPSLPLLPRWLPSSLSGVEEWGGPQRTWASAKTSSFA